MVLVNIQYTIQYTSNILSRIHPKYSAVDKYFSIHHSEFIERQSVLLLYLYNTSFAVSCVLYLCRWRGRVVIICLFQTLSCVLQKIERTQGAENALNAGIYCLYSFSQWHHMIPSADSTSDTSTRTYTHTGFGCVSVQMMLFSCWCYNSSPLFLI